MPTNQCIQNYFSKLNPVAEKIAFDISEVKAAYDHVWLTLTTIEQENIINDTIIKPEITIRYYTNCGNAASTNKHSPKEECNPKASVESIRKKSAKNNMKHNNIYTYDRQSLLTFLHQNVAFKILHDDNTGDYRDEHSYPFSYRTKSQINLAVILNNSNKPTTDATTDSCKPSLQVMTKSLPIVQRTVYKAEVEPEVEVEHQQKQIISLEMQIPKLNEDKYNESNYIVHDVDGDDEKFKLLPTKFGSKTSISSDSTDFDQDNDETKELNAENCKLLPEDVLMPKGFDFLSNW